MTVRSRVEPSINDKAPLQLSDSFDFRSSALFMFQLDCGRAGSIPFSSGKLTDVVGLTPQDVATCAAPLLNRIHPADIDSFFSAAEESARTMLDWRSEFRLHHPVKQAIWIEWQASPVHHAGKPLWHGVMRDITERKARQYPLGLDLWRLETNSGSSPIESSTFDSRVTAPTKAREISGRDAPLEAPRLRPKLVGGEMAEASNAVAVRDPEFLSLAESSPDSIVQYDRDGRILYLNSKLARDLGVVASELVGRRPNEVWPDGRYSAIQRAVLQAIDEGAQTTLEFWAVLEASDSRCHQIRVVPERDVFGRVVGALAFGRDVTELKRMEAQLREQNAFQQTLLDAINDVGMLLTIVEDGRITYVSNRKLMREFGYSAEEFEAGVPLADVLHPDDRERIMGYHMRRAAGEPVPAAYDLGMVTRSGERRDYETAVAVVSGAAPMRIVAVGKDITERKRAERELLLLQCAIDRTSEALFMLDAQFRFVVVNDAACRSLGYSRDELLGLTPLDIDPDITAEALDKLTASDANFVLESRHRAKNGQIFPVEIKGSAFTINGARYRVALVSDITARKRIERTLRFIADPGEQNFLAALARHIGDTLGVAYVMIDRLTEEPGFAETVTLFIKGEIAPNIRYALIDTPCDNVAAKRACCYVSGVQALFPKDKLLVDMDVESYAGAPLWDSTGKPIGLIAVLDTKPFEDAAAATHLLQLVAPRAAAELERSESDRQLRLREQHLEHIAHHDALTGLPNRRLLTDRLSQAIAEAKCSGQMLAVLYFDLDGFKPINDNHGHESGDRVLIDISQRLSEAVHKGDTVARIGGDEFVVLVVGISDVGECDAMIRRLLDVVNRPIAVDNCWLNLSASIGVSLYPNDDSDDADILLRYADQAMYVAKAAGRNQCAFFGSEARSKMKGDNQMIHDLRLGLNQNQIFTFYQPIIEMATGRVVKAEALARWRHPQRGMIPPSEFIPVAETGGLIHDIGDLVFKEAARVAQIWSKQAGEGIWISVNRSPRQFFGRDGVSDWVRHLVDNNIPGELLGIEITEGLLLEDQPNIIQQLNQLRAIGVTVSVDDFGTGYSSLSYLKKFAIDYLKIDRSFIRDIVDDPQDRAIVEAIIAMAKRLGVKLVAEGVETRDQADLLAAVGCDFAQGYFYAKPMSEKEFLEFVLIAPNSLR
jgi:diguanylate cyclase (GGDEF)-like protein/PAS domain S-box-containing protein